MLKLLLLFNIAVILSFATPSYSQSALDEFQDDEYLFVQLDDTPAGPDLVSPDILVDRSIYDKWIEKAAENVELMNIAVLNYCAPAKTNGLIICMVPKNYLVNQVCPNL